MFPDECHKIQGGEVYFLQQKKGEIPLIGQLVEGKFLDNEISGCSLMRPPVPGRS